MTNRLLLGGFLAGALAALSVCASDVTFTTKPKVVREGAAARISFAVSTNTDVEVAVLDATNGVVRHLAAGVLNGVHTPPEPLKSGLEQSLVWDGTDDFGKPVPGARKPFSVRVRAGMGAKLGRLIAQDPYVFGGIDAMVVGDDGNLYVSGFSGPANECQKTIRVFSPEGKFVRTVLPFPADLPPGAMKDVARWDEAAKSWRPRNLNILNPEFYNNNNGYADYQLVSASVSNGIVLVSKGAVYRIDLQGAIPGTSFDTGQNPWPVFDAKNAENNHYGHPFHYHGGPVLFAASPDGRYLFLSGPIPNKENQKRTTTRFPLRRSSAWRSMARTR